MTRIQVCGMFGGMRNGGSALYVMVVMCTVMADAYTPVFKSILTSTIWLEKSHVKVVWITMLLLCDKNGIVEGAVPGIANSAVVSVDECREAIRVLLSPDPDSRTKEFEGRRVEEIDGGWRILNHRKHREKLGLSSVGNATRVARHRAKKRGVTLQALAVTGVMPVTGVMGNCNEQEQEQYQEQNTTAAATSRVACPPNLRLTDDQRAVLETSLIPGWAIDELTNQYVAAEVADQTKTMPLSAWHKCLSRAISGNWNNQQRRPKKPQVEGEQPKTGGLPGQTWHKDGYWYYAIAKETA